MPAAGLGRFGVLEVYGPEPITQLLEKYTYMANQLSTESQKEKKIGLSEVSPQF